MDQRIKRVTLIILFLGAVSLGGCTSNTTGSSVFDPYENTNRKTHEFNKNLDKSILRPASNTYVAIIPSPVVTGVSNFSSNLEMPVMILNGLLQLDFEGVSKNTGRFLINSSVGILGIFDVASSLQIYGKSTNFNETLYSYGIGEGAYTELPFFSSNTERSAAGLVLNFAVNPYQGVFTGAREAIPISAKVLDLMGKRHRYSDTIEGVLYNSDDSYAQSRQIYLERMRFNLEGKLESDVYENPYASD
jgi:phospholipid-binding lipoprotein MlaA